MLLYLCHETYLGDKGDALSEELRCARQAGFPIVMLHETDTDNGGCEFARFFETTPGDLIAGGLYKMLAIAACPGVFWPVSVALVARALGATPHSRRRQGSFLPGEERAASRTGSRTARSLLPSSFRRATSSARAQSSPMPSVSPTPKSVTV